MQTLTKRGITLATLTSGGTLTIDCTFARLFANDTPWHGHRCHCHALSGGDHDAQGAGGQP